MRNESEKIAQLRKQAKALSKETNEKHTKCLHEIAKTKGFASWDGLIKSEEYK